MKINQNNFLLESLVDQLATPVDSIGSEGKESILAKMIIPSFLQHLFDSLWKLLLVSCMDKDIFIFLCRILKHKDSIIIRGTMMVYG